MSSSMQIYWNKGKCLHKKRVQLPQSTVGKKMATGTFTYNALRTKALKERIKTQRKIASHSNSTRAMLLV